MTKPLSEFVHLPRIKHWQDKMYFNKCFVLFVNASILLGFFIFSTLSWGEDKHRKISPYTASDVLEHLEKSRQIISNVTLECIWDSHMEGSPSSWEKQTFIWDDLGRRRIISENGLLLKDGTRKPSEETVTIDTIFDGEILAYSKYYPDLDRVGNVPKEGEKPSGYNPVIIGDATSPLHSDLNSQRNPFEYIRNVAIPAIKEGIKNNKIVVFQSSSDIDEIDVVITLIPNSKQAITKNVITIVPKQNWGIKSVNSYNKKGTLVREIKFEYTKQADGLWIPSKGRDIHWGERQQEQPPYLNWGFVVNKVLFNDPEFVESVFEIKLSPDAAVSDTRYKVAYRAGSEGLVTSQLEQYAEEARKAAEASKLSLRRGPGFSKLKKGNNLGRIFLIANVAMLAISAALFLLVRWKRQKIKD